MKGIAGKRVFVSAAAAGIGRAIADRFLQAGAFVCLCDVDETALNRLEGSSDGLRGVRADVADPAQMETAFQEVVQILGGLDVLVNNAGISGPTANTESITPEDWQRTIDVNLNGAFYCSRLAIPLLKASGGGSIINIGSTAGLHGYPLRAPYAASKWALVGFTKTMAMELGPFGIRVNAVCPGSVQGPRIEGVYAAKAAARGVSVEEIRDAFRQKSSLRTLIDADDVAETVLFLCSAGGARIAGQVLAVDGHTETMRM
ncbi:MAG: SDR family oxidoreductase [Caldilineaceae bacterium SB0670_bin_27]|uniref:SDR family oxidoreductase n=1 Tax=Caldilineaceae bacterium SB0664_bin_27 TaxID=2605260 RepID=A0A6B0YLV3_9CHLR|nr:SDR family oxidoreductase [Caldilineaceae bacterium SB0664_bin_27]MYJ77499.1 SDR family oxidoreductase [Caldilineaceae bacterium SB0670_bin_27]